MALMLLQHRDDIICILHMLDIMYDILLRYVLRIAFQDGCEHGDHQ